MLFALFLLMFLSSAKSQKVWTVDDFDKVAARLFPFGDPYNFLPINITDAESLCAQYNQLSSLALPYLCDTEKLYGITGANNLSADVVCQLYRNSPIDMIKFAVEVNYKFNQMIEFRQKICNLGAYIGYGKDGHDFCLNYPLIGCYLRTWYSGISNVLSDQSKLIMNKISAFYVGFADAFSPQPVCDYSIVPNATPSKFQSFDLNHLIAVKNCFTVY